MKTLNGNSSKTGSDNTPFTYTCPFLGMADDPTTATLFPSDSNYCFHCKPPAVPDAIHQARYCLTQSFDACTLKQEFSPGRMPAKYRWHKTPAITRATLLKAGAGAGIALFLALFFILWVPGIITDVLMSFAPTPASGGTWPTLTPSATSESTTAAPPPATATPGFTATGAYTFTPIAFPDFLKVTVIVDGLSCRAGLTDDSPRIALWELGEELVSFARDESGAFLFVRKPDSGIADCWIKSQYTISQGYTTLLPVFTPVPGAYPSPVSTLTPTFTSTPVRDDPPTAVPTKKPTKTPTSTPTVTPTPTDAPTPLPTWEVFPIDPP